MYMYIYVCVCVCVSTCFSFHVITSIQVGSERPFGSSFHLLWEL